MNSHAYFGWIRYIEFKIKELSGVKHDITISKFFFSFFLNMTNSAQCNTILRLGALRHYELRCITSTIIVVRCSTLQYSTVHINSTSRSLALIHRSTVIKYHQNFCSAIYKVHTIIASLTMLS